MKRVLSTEELYDALTVAHVAAVNDGDNDSADQIEKVIDELEPFAAGYICTALGPVVDA